MPLVKGTIARLVDLQKELQLLKFYLLIIIRYLGLAKPNI